jgi:hypothetical protein
MHVKWSLWTDSLKNGLSFVELFILVGYCNFNDVILLAIHILGTLGDLLNTGFLNDSLVLEDGGLASLPFLFEKRFIVRCARIVVCWSILWLHKLLLEFVYRD